jgi:hypothetical protein
MGFSALFEVPRKQIYQRQTDIHTEKNATSKWGLGIFDGGGRQTIQLRDVRNEHKYA